MTFTDQDLAQVLWLSIEDYAGLWEVPWDLRNLHPEASDAELRQLGIAVESHLLTLGWIELVATAEPDGSPMPVTDFQTAMRPESWLVPASEGTAIRISATSDGEAAHRAM